MTDVSITRLSLSNFRSYRDALIEADPGIVILIGENGAGKTNLLEAASLLSPGRGLRGTGLSGLASIGGPGGFAVSVRIDALPGHAPVDIGTGTTSAAPERRQVRINGAQASATSLAEWLSVLWLTPAMDRLFVEGATGRRRFLDRLVLALAPTHAVHASRYEAAMRARNKLLGEDRPDTDWLAALEARMAEHGIALALARQGTVSTLSERLDLAAEGPFARAGIALGGWGGSDAEAFRVELARSRGRDAAAGRTLCGPHRADLLVTHLGKNQPAERCSTGEQKALLLGLVLAHADLVAERTGRRPILLLDEVAAHLDPLRRAALFERLADRGGQVWMTGTEPALFAAIGQQASRFDVADGQVRPV